MLVGGVPAGLIAWVLFFIPIRRVISNYQTRRHAMRVKRQQFLAEQSQQKQSDLTDGYSDGVDELTIPSSKVIEQSAGTHTPMNTNTKDRKSR